MSAKKSTKINHDIFFFLDKLFAASKKIRKRVRRDFVAGRMTSTEFAMKTIALERAYDARYFEIFRRYA